jgi:lantibiotic modifying enzyme
MCGKPSGPDHLCCGEAGRLVALMRGAQYLERGDLADEARRRALRLSQAALEGDLRFYIPGPAHFIPGLFSGIAGVGLSLLTALEPERIPCPLTWQ